MVICIKAHKIAYMAIPKAACSSVKAALCAIDPDARIPKSKIKGRVDELHIQYPTKRFRLHRWNLYEDHWRFTVIRDPLKRLMSVYSDRKEQKRDLFRSPRLRESNLPDDPDPDFFFEHLQEYFGLSSVIKHHILPASIFIGPDLTRYDKIYRVEDLDHLAADISNRINAPISIPRLNKSTYSLSFDDLSPKAKAVIRKHLGSDYTLLSRYYSKR